MNEYVIDITGKEYNVLRMQNWGFGEDPGYCRIRHNPDRMWRWQAVFSSLIQARLAMDHIKQITPYHAAISMPYKSLCAKIKDLLYENVEAFHQEIQAMHSRVVSQ